MNGGRQCMGSVGMKNGGEYSTGVKLNVVGISESRVVVGNRSSLCS